MTARRPDLARAAGIAVVAIALDQITKSVARNGVSPGEQVDFVAGIHFVRVSNSGIAFGMLEDAGPAVLVIAAVAFALLLGAFLSSAERPGLWLPVGLLAGGAIGNLIDRIRDGAVTDFIDLPHWPAFNVADMEITAGVLILIAIYLLAPEPAESHSAPD